MVEKPMIHFLIQFHFKGSDKANFAHVFAMDASEAMSTFMECSNDAIIDNITVEESL